MKTRISFLTETILNDREFTCCLKRVFKDFCGGIVMFKFTGFSSKANAAINHAMSQAAVLGHSYIGSEHLLLGLSLIHI